MDCPGMTPEMKRETRRLYLESLVLTLGSEAGAAATHAESARIESKYRPGVVPNDSGAERAAVDRWNAAHQLATEVAFARWGTFLEQGATIRVEFRPTYRVRVRRELVAGYAQDSARLSILSGEYVVELDAPAGHLIFRGADRRDGGDLFVKLVEYLELAAFPNELANTQLEVIEGLY